MLSPGPRRRCRRRSAHRRCRVSGRACAAMNARTPGAAGYSARAAARPSRGGRLPRRTASAGPAPRRGGNRCRSSASRPRPTAARARSPSRSMWLGRAVDLEGGAGLAPRLRRSRRSPGRTRPTADELVGGMADDVHERMADGAEAPARELDRRPARPDRAATPARCRTARGPRPGSRGGRLAGCRPRCRGGSSSAETARAARRSRRAAARWSSSASVRDAPQPLTNDR